VSIKTIPAIYAHFLTTGINSRITTGTKGGGEKGWQKQVENITENHVPHATMQGRNLTF
jgi:hypothetical protein